MRGIHYAAVDAIRHAAFEHDFNKHGKIVDTTKSAFAAL
jgi:hypothetical protein